MSFQFVETLMSLRLGKVIFQKNNPAFKWVVFAASWELLRCSYEKRIKNHTEAVYLEVFHAESELQLKKMSKDAILFSRQSKTVLWGEMVTNSRKIYFHTDENASSEQIYSLFDDVESADKDDTYNLIDNSDTEFIAEDYISS